VATLLASNIAALIVLIKSPGLVIVCLTMYKHKKLHVSLEMKISIKKERNKQTSDCY